MQRSAVVHRVVRFPLTLGPSSLMKVFSPEIARPVMVLTAEASFAEAVK
jgi:hypothetical protein